MNRIIDPYFATPQKKHILWDVALLLALLGLPLLPILLDGSSLSLWLMGIGCLVWAAVFVVYTFHRTKGRFKKLY